MGEQVSLEFSERPIGWPDIRGIMVMSDAVLDLRALVEEMRDEVQELRRVNANQWHIVKFFADIALEVLDEKDWRRAVAEQMRKYARESERTKLPTWFFRVEENSSIETMLRRRIEFAFFEAKLMLDDCWDSILEFLTDHLKPEQPISNEDLERLFREVQAGRGRDASTSES